MRQSVSSRVVSALLRAVFHSRFVDNANVSNQAGKKTAHKPSRYKPPKGFTYARYACGDAHYEVLTPTENCGDKVILHLHGGSFKVKLIDTYRRLAAYYSKCFDNAVVVSVDYRIFPAHTYPAQQEDVLSVWHTLLEQGVAPKKVIFLGDSAGANLALSVPLRLRDSGEPLPGGIVCFSLWGDTAAQGESYERNAYLDPFCGIARREKVEAHLEYLHRISAYAQKLDRNDPYVSPSFADFRGFPPVTLVCGGGEVGESDSDTAYANLLAAGADAVLYKYKNLFHDFQLFRFFPESRDAYRKVRERIRQI